MEIDFEFRAEGEFLRLRAGEQAVRRNLFSIARFPSPTHRDLCCFKCMALLGVIHPPCDDPVIYPVTLPLAGAWMNQANDSAKLVFQRRSPLAGVITRFRLSFSGWMVTDMPWNFQPIEINEMLQLNYFVSKISAAHDFEAALAELSG